MSAEAGIPGAEALAALDVVLSRRPHRDDHRLSEATRGLTRLRDAMIADHRRSGAPDAEGRRRLAHLNAVISAVLGGHFPSGETPWEELERARSWLAELVEAG